MCNLKFEVINKNNETIFWTVMYSCIPRKSEIDSLYQTGCKFKFNGKNISKTKIEEIRSNKNENSN